MPLDSDSHHVAITRAAARASIAAGVLTAAVGTLAVYGWGADVQSFKTIYGPITMKANTAIGLMLAGVSLATLRQFPRFSMSCAFIAGILGTCTLTEHLTGWDLGIDQLFFTETPGAEATTSPNRMGPNAATAFILAAVALVLLARGRARGASIAQRLAVVALTLAAVPLVGYVYGARQLYGIAAYTGIALHTSLAFGLLHIGILLARANEGPMATFLSDGPAGTMLRRLALPVAAIPLALGYLEISARDADLVDRGLGMALYTVSLIVVLFIMVWHTSQVIAHSDRARSQAERDRDLLIVSERQARTEAERANQLKDRFLATISHELRTPLNVMLGWTQILEQSTERQDHVRIAQLVAKNGRLLTRLVEDLLDLSRVTAGQLEISRAPTHLNTVVQNSVEGVALAAAAKGVELLIDLDPNMRPIEADAQRLLQVMSNLLSNSVKFTPAGGRISVRSSDTGEAVAVIVEDSGIGFDESFAADIFKPFRQADPSTSREHGGLGLGLSIARHIAELHGGILTGSSAGTGSGATFTLTLPRIAAGAAPISAREDVIGT